MANELNSKIIAQMIDLNRNMGQLTAEVKKNSGIIKSSQEEAGRNSTKESTTSSTSGIEKTVPLFEEISKDLKRLIANTEKNNQENKERQEKKENESKEKEKKDKAPFDFKSLANALLKTDAFKPYLDKASENFEGLNVFRKLTRSLTPEILKNFQTGGVVNKEGNYLVGENGPEIVKLPLSSAVIPLDIKDLSEGLTKIPELSKIVKEGKI
jgi:flagellar biosynthesis GTPase FlhF